MPSIAWARVANLLALMKRVRLTREQALRLHWVNTVRRELCQARIMLGTQTPHLAARIDAALEEASKLERRLVLEGRKMTP